MSNKFIVTQPTGLFLVEQDKLASALWGRDLDTTKIYARVEHLPRHTGNAQTVAGAAILAADRANTATPAPDVTACSKIIKDQREIIEGYERLTEDMRREVAALRDKLADIPKQPNARSVFDGQVAIIAKQRDEIFRLDAELNKSRRENSTLMQAVKPLQDGILRRDAEIERLNSVVKRLQSKCEGIIKNWLNQDQCCQQSETGAYSRGA